MDEFADIRPYTDEEVRPVLDRLLADDELIIAIGRLRLGRWYQRIPWLFGPIVRTVLTRELVGVNSVPELQLLVKKYMDAMIERSSSGFTVSGLEALDPQKPYLFMSNHRDIALDPALINYAMYHNGHDTVRIAIGDNLLTKPWVSDLMRLNKSFIVKRSTKGPRQVLAAYKKLSAYIRYSIETDDNPIWIAQREGRAKDGIDRTEPAIIKMLAMAQNKAEESFAEYINKLSIVPVAISYEFDPCDGAKARELNQRKSSGSYQKQEHEDVASIALGITGNKGRVHVAFGTPLQGDFAGADAVADAIDAQVLGKYVMHPTNYFAYQQLHGGYPDGPVGALGVPFVAEHYPRELRIFTERMAALSEAERPYALGIYANPIDSQRQLSEQPAPSDLLIQSDSSI